MLPELGNFSLILALALALLLSLWPLIGVQLKNEAWIKLARPLAYALGGFILFSYACLTYSFIINDFTVTYVANNSSIQLPVWYRICAVWGAHEGSMLLWVTILSVWTMAVAWCSASLPKETVARVLAVMGMISVGFILFILATSNPFLRILTNVPVNGADLNPLLQDIGLISHPPMLYMGYVGFSVVFAFAIAALMAGKLDTAWIKWSRPWTLAAWCFLSLGITLGSWWAYRELGWGGFWFWDPVENASFLPWLTGTALIHSLAVCEKRNVFKAWTVLLAICAFSLSLLGTFLVRSGVLTSVHAFAVDPSRGRYMLIFLGIVIGGSLSLYAWRAQQVRDDKVTFKLLSRETLLLSNNIFLSVAMLTILLGTLYPLIIQALGLAKLSVGAPYFNTVFIPLIIPLLLLMGIGPHSHWGSITAKKLMARLRIAFILSIIIAATALIIFTQQFNWQVLIAFFAAVWIIVTSLQYVLNHYRKTNSLRLSRAQYGMLAAHIGVAVTVIGITFSSAFSIERNVRMAPGDQVSAGPYQFIFVNTHAINGPNYHGIAGQFTVQKAHHYLTTLQPEKRIFDIQHMAMTDAAIDAGIFRDLYIALGEPLQGQAWSVRIYYKPFVRWIWSGGLLILLGGILAALDRHYWVRVTEQKPGFTWLRARVRARARNG